MGGEDISPEDMFSDQSMIGDSVFDGGPGSGRKPEGGTKLSLPNGFTGKESDMEIFKNLDVNIIKEYNKIIVNTTASNGIKITGIKGHAYAQATRRDVSAEDIKDTLLNGKAGAIKGNGTQYIQSSNYKICVDTKTGNVITIVNKNLDY